MKCLVYEKVYFNLENCLVESNTINYIESSGDLTGLLLGKGHLVRIPEEDEKLIEKLVNRLDEATFLVYSCRRIFLPCLGYNGQVLRTGEYVIFNDIQNTDEERVICIEELISINCGFDYEIFCKCTQFLFVKNDSG